MDEPGLTWARFPHDPREPATAGMRASDADRAIVAEVLAEAYGDGRLDLEEHGERSEQLASTRTLGELPPLVSDLIPTTSALVARPLVRSPAVLQTEAEEHWRSRMRSAAWGALVPSLICVVVWLAVSLPSSPGFPWPVFVILGTGINVGRTFVMRREIVADRVAAQQRADRKRLEKHERRRR